MDNGKVREVSRGAVDYSFNTEVEDLGVCVLQKEGRVTLYHLNLSKGRQVEVDKEIQLNQPYSTIEWVSNSIYLAQPNKYFSILNTEKGSLRELKIPCGTNPFIHPIAKSQVLFLNNFN